TRDWGFGIRDSLRHAVTLPQRLGFRDWGFGIRCVTLSRCLARTRDSGFGIRDSLRHAVTAASNHEEQGQGMQRASVIQPTPNPESRIPDTYTASARRPVAGRERKRSMNDVLSLPATNSGSFRIRRCSGIVVLIPSITVISSVRFMRAIASCRSRPWTMIFAISES